MSTTPLQGAVSIVSDLGHPFTTPRHTMGSRVPVTIARVTSPQIYRTSFAIPAEQGSAPPTLVAQVVRLPHNCTVDEHPACNEATHARYRLPPMPRESSQRAFAVIGAPSPAQR